MRARYDLATITAFLLYVSMLPLGDYMAASELETSAIRSCFPRIAYVC